jgi:hypothetical protein
MQKKDQNDVDKSPQLLHQFKIQGQVMKAAHKSKMNDCNNDDKKPMAGVIFWTQKSGITTLMIQPMMLHEQLS